MRSAGAILIAVVACSAALLSPSAAANRDDALIVKVKTALIAAAIPEARQIEVQVFNGEAERSGFVESADSKAAAARVVGTVQGVTSVRNDLNVREQ